MQFQIESTALADALSIVCKAQQKKNAIPVLDCVLLTVNDNTLTISSSDSEIYLQTTVSLIESDGNFSVAVLPDAFNILKALAPQPITVECSVLSDSTDGYVGTTVYYHNGQNVNNSGLVGDMFPLPVEPTGDIISRSLPLSTMLEGLRYTMFATDDNELKPQMSGVYYDMQNYGMINVASDGNYMAKAWFKDIITETPFGFVLPNRTIRILSEMLRKSPADNEVSIIYSGTNYRIATGDFTLYGRLVDMQYPNYNSVIPQSHNASATISRLDLIGATKRVSLSSEIGSIILHFSQGGVVVLAEHQDRSKSAKETVPCEYTGSPLAVVVLAQYLLDILNALDKIEDLTLNLISPSHPIVITPQEQEQNKDILYLLMPIAPQ